MTEQSETKIETEAQNKLKLPHEDYPGSVLLSDHINEFVKAEYLIVKEPPENTDPHYKVGELTFERGQLDRAKYNFRLGKKYFQAGEFGYLIDKTSTLQIGAYELVFVESYEVFKIPPNVAGAYDLRISHCMSGLGLQTGLQIDPGYYGRIFSGVFNFSDEPVRLTYGDHFGSIHFIYTTFDPDINTPSDSDSEKKTNAFGGTNKVFSLDKALRRRTSTGVDTVWAKIQRIQRDIEEDHKKLVEARNETQNVNTVFLAVVGLVLTAISAILVPEAIGRAGTTSLLSVLIIGVVFLCTVFMLLRFVKSLFNRDNPQSPSKRGKDDSDTTKE